MKDSFSQNTIIQIGFGASLLLPSLGIIQKYFGTPLILAYLVGGFCLLVASLRIFPWAFVSQVSQKHVLLFAVFTVLVLLTIFLGLYPLADRGLLGQGSDHDDSLDQAVTEIIHGRYPYYPRTYLDGPITKLPGAIFLAIPFVLLGTSAYQNIFWLALFVFVAPRSVLQTRFSLLLVWFIFCFSPVIWQRYITGGDLLANNLSILISALFLLDSMHGQDSPSCLTRRLVASLAFGVALSSRFNFLLLVPQVFASIHHRVGFKSALRYIMLSFLVFVALTLPFYCFDPSGFAPLELLHLFASWDILLPFASATIISASVVLSFVLCFHSFHSMADDPTNSVFLRNCALVQAFPIFCGLLLPILVTGNIDLGFADFGMNFLFFGALSAWIPLLHRNGCDMR
jgi:hypothetical protein